MAAVSSRWAWAFAAAALSAPAGMPCAQELTRPAEGLVIAWRSPAVPTMPTVIWTIAPGEGRFPRFAPGRARRSSG